MKYSIVIPQEINERLKDHLIRKDGQEDLCFALYSPSTGIERKTGIINEIILPILGDRNIHGNVSFNSQFFDNVTKKALYHKKGIVFIHSHPFPGWQNMSNDDYLAEEMLAPRAKVISNLPLIGMTIGSNGDWSGRFWIKNGPKKYKPIWTESVRVVGRNFSITLNNKILKSHRFQEEFTRTISSWGENKQNILARLKIGIVGVGSVGSQIAEALVRTGIGVVKLIDFDIIEAKNLDRLHGITRKEIGSLKTEVYLKLLSSYRLGSFQKIYSVPNSIYAKVGFESALDCDLLFCCVDRPWARFILNCIAYSSLIPVIDGGIDASYSKIKDNIEQARWRAYVSAPQRRCLKCMGQYKPEDVSLEQTGLLEDQNYIKGLPNDHFIKRGENVYSFSLSLAAMQMQQFLSYILNPKNIVYGPKEMDFITGNIDFLFKFHCDDNCEFNDMLGIGDGIKNSLIKD